MADLKPSIRLKVQRDLFYLPDADGGVYLRNNFLSFRLKGKTIAKWIEKLIPMFNGTHTLEELTAGLPKAYKEQVYKIAETLYQHGLVRDVSQDIPHQLSQEIQQTYASQIEFIDYFGGSGAYRFQCYRKSKVLAIGSGSFFVSLVASLLESGLPRFYMLITDTMPTNRKRIQELEDHKRKVDREVLLEEVAYDKEKGWWEVIQPFEAILYVSQDGDVEELKTLNAICKEAKKLFLPAICHKQVGMAGPLLHPDTEGCWESAWRRIHSTVFDKGSQLQQAYSATAGALLANVITFELVKKITGIDNATQTKPFFLLDLKTLEGNWHSYLPHPFVSGFPQITRVENIDQLLQKDEKKNGNILTFFSQLTSPEAGIFHQWEEGDLPQLPLSRCKVQVVDPLSKGPAKLLPEMIVSGLTHEEARREAGLSGIEAYVSRMVELLLDDRLVDSEEFASIGTGETVAEALYRGLQKCLTEELEKRQADEIPSVVRVSVDKVEDKYCRFYLQALTAIDKDPIIGLGEELFGFPVMWVKLNGQWYRNVGIHKTLALRSALQQALAASQSSRNESYIPVDLQAREQQNLIIPAYEEMRYQELVQFAMQVLKENGQEITVLDLTLEPFLKENLAGVFGVLLREEESDCVRS